MMGRFVFLLFCLISSFTSYGQILQPVKWSFSSVKNKDNTQSIILSAAIDKDWHLYSQHTPEGGPIPTAITFQANRAIELNGEVQEKGDMESKMDDMFGVKVQSFANRVDFVQKIKLKMPVSTYLLGSVEFMVCDNTRCLPPEIQTFKIKIDK